MIDQATRRLVWERARHRCEFCHIEQAAAVYAPFHMDHVVPRQHGGGDEIENLALACNHCNFHKGSNLSAIDPETERVVELFSPRRHDWDEHFQVNGTVIEGKTATGRATATLLRMNAPARQRLRVANRFSL